MTVAGDNLLLNDDVLQRIVEWQRHDASREVCGLLALDERGDQHILRLTNNAPLADEFEIYQSEEDVAYAAAQQRHWTVVAFIHTHPHHGPEMSARDARCFARDTLPWIIVGAPWSGPQQRAYSRLLLQPHP